MKYMTERPATIAAASPMTRRESLQLLGLGIAAAAAIPTPGVSAEPCVLSPELTVGPYYVQRERVRRVISENKPGIPLLLRVTLLDYHRCAPLANAAVDIWHCDAMGFYSGYTAIDPDAPIGGPPGGSRAQGSGNSPNGTGGRRGPPPEGDVAPNFAPPTDTLTFFRGLQFTNAKGVAEFVTIYPGWYYGRATHIHLKVHVEGHASGTAYEDGHVCHVGQLAFPEELGDRVAQLPPYSAHKLARTRIDNDSVFTEETASEGMVQLRQVSRDVTRGFVGSVALAVNPTITPKHAPMNGALFQKRG